MNRYPLWKNILVAVTLALGLLYTLPNFFGEAPAVQVSSVRATVKIDSSLLTRVEGTLKTAGIEPDGLFVDDNSIRVRLKDGDSQLKAKDAIEKALNPVANDASYSVALNLLSSSPLWLTNLHALPMYLGLDLRGGVHFLLQVDMKGALTKRLDATGADLRSLLRDKNVRHAGIGREGMTLVVKFRETETRDKARSVISDAQPDLLFTESQDGPDFKLTGALSPAAEKRIQEYALKQNITTLHNRINELGVAEPVIQQQGADRIVVQLPGVQDTAKAKDILGRTATLEVRMVDDENSANPTVMEQAAKGQPPLNTELYTERGGRSLLVRKQVVLTGERLTDAQPGFDNQTHEPAVHLTLDSAGARIFKELTRDNVGKRMAIVLIEKGKGEVVTAPVIRSEIGGGRVQISGR
ncbi:MAG: preprotein translocase subunit SecD, partial [Proteobacteria bacterium]|nr:preprotein translocase subunit SecD [Pseudomonadota bacterium]